jgi:hypothetical protein
LIIFISPISSPLNLPSPVGCYPQTVPLFYTHAILCFSFFGSIGVWTQGPSLTRRYSITWAMPLSLFCFTYFSERVSHFCLGLALSYNPPAYASRVARMTGICHSHCAQLFDWDGSLIKFLPRLVLNHDSLRSLPLCTLLI